MNMPTDRLERLEEVLDRQALEIADLKSQLATATAPMDTASEPSPMQARSTRRSMLLGGAAAAGAAVVGSMAKPTTASATDGGNMVIGANNTSEAGNTRLVAGSAGALSGVNILTASDNATSSSYEAAIGAVAQGVKVTNGVYGFTSARDGGTSTGHAVVARKTSGGRSNIYMPPSGSPPTGDSYAHSAGELRVDFNGALWYCTMSGTPGRWLRLAGQESSGAVHAVTPTRVYDSRFADGPLASGFNRLVSVASSIDVETGVVVNSAFVPPGATAITFNLTITETTGAGFVFVAPGNATEVTSSTVNWSGTGVTVANASLTTVDDRQIRAFVGGSGSTHFIIDVTAYTI